MRTLQLTVASFPAHWHGAANKMDFERELMKTITVGWPSLAIQVAPRQKTVVMPGQGARTPEFAKILTGGRYSRRLGAIVVVPSQSPQFDQPQAA
jgi:hypothetical protein